MKAGSMEGLIGASTNIKMVDVPMRIYREAERKGDTATMERAMGYASEFTQKAYDYKEQAQDELRKELKEERKELEEKKKEQLEEKREGGKEVEAEKRDVEISEEGHELDIENTDKKQYVAKEKIDMPKSYDKNGDVVTGLKENTISVKI